MFLLHNISFRKCNIVLLHERMGIFFIVICTEYLVILFVLVKNGKKCISTKKNKGEEIAKQLVLCSLSPRKRSLKYFVRKSSHGG